MIPAARTIDAAVHCQTPPVDRLLPYLSDYWASYVHEVFLGGTTSGTGRLHVTAGANFTYPNWAESLALRPELVSLEAIRATVLSRSERAIIHCYAGAEAFTHPYFAPALATAANHWLEDEWLAKEDRLLGTAVVAPQHTASAVAEVHRIAESGRFIQIALPARSVEPYGNQRFWPILDAAAERGLAVAITYGGASLTAPTPVHWPSSFFELYANAPLQFGTHVASLVLSGIFERLPELRVILVESGWTWLPPLLWRMDWEWRASRREVPWVKEAPSQYVRSNLRVTSHPVDAPDDPAQLGQVIAQLECDELLMFASDHPRSHEPAVKELVSLMSSGQAHRVLRRNAIETYGLQ